MSNSFYGTNTRGHLFMSFSIWLLQSSVSSIITPNDLVLVTCLTLTPLIVSVGESVRLLCLCLDPMKVVYK